MQSLQGWTWKTKTWLRDIYIKAAERIGLQPEECLVIEDAVSGIKAAKISRMQMSCSYNLI